MHVDVKYDGIIFPLLPTAPHSPPSQPLSPVTAACMWDPPQEPEKPIGSHIFKSEWISLPQQLFTAKSSSVRGERWCWHGLLQVLCGWPQLLWVWVPWPHHVWKTANHSTPLHLPALAFFLPPLHGMTQKSNLWMDDQTLFLSFLLKLRI